MAEKYQIYRQILELLRELPASPEVELRTSSLETILNAADEGKPIVFYNFTLEAELFIAMDLPHIMPEGWTHWRSIIEGESCNTPFIDAAHEAGIPPELCSADKMTIGALLLGEYPPPAMIVSASFPCDNEKIMYQIMQSLTGAPLYLLDCPYWMDEGEAMDYWVNQYKGLISFLEEHTGKKLDYDRLKEVTEESNRFLDYYLEAMELVKLVPMPGTPPRGRAGIGLPKGTQVIKARRDNLKARAARGETQVPEEKVRIIWAYVPTAWDMPGLEDWLEEEFGAVVPVGMLNYFPAEPVDTSTPESIIRGLAKRNLNGFMGRYGKTSADLWLEDTLYWYEEWKGDCIILAAHMGCKYLRGNYGLLKDIAREQGIPVMLYDTDTFDPRITSREEAHAKIEQFLETVVPRRSGGN